jgi:uncharacterized protein (TIGR02145 family)
MKLLVFQTKFFLLSTFCFGILFSSFSQSKKEQFELLNNRLDSLIIVLNSETIANAEHVNELNSTILNLQNQLTSLNANIEKLYKELENFMLSHNNTQINQVTQKGDYKFIKIGMQTWMSENLNVSTFRNGDPIPEIKTNEEWEKAYKEGKPAWCYYDNDSKNGIKYGKLYNWHAVNDSRGLAPHGWHVPTDAEWIMLSNYLGKDAGKKMKSTSGWNKNGNGTNESGFSGLPGGSCFGNFHDIGNYGYWWSSTENFSDFTTPREMIFPRHLGINSDDLKSYGGTKEPGYSVRCVKD